MMTNTVCLSVEEYNRLYKTVLQLKEVEEALAEAYSDIQDLVLHNDKLEEELALVKSELDETKNSSLYWWRLYNDVQVKADDGVVTLAD